MPHPEYPYADDPLFDGDEPDLDGGYDDYDDYEDEEDN